MNNWALSISFNNNQYYVYFRKKSDNQVLLSKNSMKALRGMVFKKVQSLLDAKRIEDPEICGYGVFLLSVAARQLRELRLHGHSNRHQPQI